MAEVIITNVQDKFDVTKELKELLCKTVNIALSKEKITENIEVSIVLADDSYIRELNKQYRSLDKPTDVLSFAMREKIFEEDKNLKFVEDEPLGDIVISLERARAQALEYGHSFEREIGFLTVHGVLHLLGYDHKNEEEKKVMRQKEEEILKAANLTRGISENEKSKNNF